MPFRAAPPPGCVREWLPRAALQFKISRMKRFLKENLVLAMGVALPVLLVVFFLIATWLPSLFVASPKYDFLFSNGNIYSAKGWISTRIENGRLKITERISNDNCNTYQEYKLYLLEASTGNVRRLANIPSPSSEARCRNPQPLSSYEREVLVEQIKNYKFSSEPAAPDGYVLRISASGGGGFPFFYSGGWRNRFSLYKNGRSVKIEMPDEEERRYYEVSAIGWVVEKP